MGHFVCLGLHVNLLQDFLYALVHAFPVLPSGATQDEEQIVVHGAVHQQLEVLKDDSDAATQVRDVAFFEPVQGEISDTAFSFSEREFSDEGSDDGSFSTADFSNQVYKFAGLDAQIDMGQHQIVGVGNVGVRQFDQGSRVCFCCWITHRFFVTLTAYKCRNIASFFLILLLYKSLMDMKKSYHYLWKICLGILLCYATFPVELQAQNKVYELQNRLHTAKQLFENDLYVSAQKEFAQLLELCPSDGLLQCELEGYHLLCQILLKRPNLDGLVADFAQQYPYSPELARVLFHYSVYYFEQENYVRSLEIMEGLQDAYLRKDERLEYLFNRAFCDLRTGNYTRSQAGFNKLLGMERNPFTQSSTYYLAYVYYVERKFEQALPLFKSLLAHNRYGVMSRYFWVESKFMMNDHEAVVNAGPELYPDLDKEYQPRLARIISEAYFSMENPQEAQKYLFMYEKSGGAMSRRDHYYAGIVSYSLGGYHAAADSFLKVVGTRDSIGQGASYYLGDTYLKLKNKHSAIDAFKTAAEAEFDPVLREDAWFQYAKLMFDVKNDINPFYAYLLQYPSSSRSDEIHAYIATSYLLAKDFRPALESLAKIRTLTPEMRSNYQKAAYFRGMQLLERGAYRAAIEQFQVSLKYADCNASLANLTHYWLAESLYRTEDYAGAVQINQRLVQLPGYDKTEEYPGTLYNLAYALYSQKQYAQAAPWFQQYLNQTPSKRPFTADAQTRLADCYFMQRDYERSAELYEQVANTNYNRNDLYPRYQGAMSYGLLSKFDKKIDLLRNITDLSPNSPIYPMALYELGRTYVQTGKNGRAKQCYEKLMNDVRDSVYFTKAMLELGMIASNEGDTKAALSYYSTLVEQYPLSEESASALSGIEALYQRLNQPEEFLAYLERIGMSSLKSADEKELMFFNAAEQLFLAGNYGEAQASLKNYIAKYPQGSRLSQAYFYQAECLREAGSLEAAADAYHKVMLIGEGSFSELATLNYANLCLDLEKHEEAVLAYETLANIAKLDNNRLVAQVGRMRAYFRAGHPAKALSCAEQVRKLESGSDLAALHREADYIRAKSLLSLGERERAKVILESLAQQWSVLPEGAEAAYLLTQDAYDEGNFELVEERVYALSDTGTPQTYWLARAFIVLGDSFAEREEWEQADATFRSILEEYKPMGEHDDILEQVQMRLDRLPKLSVVE